MKKGIYLKPIVSLKQISKYPFPLICQVLLDKFSFQTVQIRKFYLLQYMGCPADFNSRGPGMIRVAEPSDVNNMEMLEKAGKQKLFIDRFSVGERCSVAVHNGMIVGYEWHTNKSYHQEERYLFNIVIPDNAVFAYDAFIKPEYRISGIWIKFKMYLGERMREMGRDRIITLIDSDNRLSMNTHTRFGFTAFKSVYYFKLANKRYFAERKLDHGAEN